MATVRDHGLETTLNLTVILDAAERSVAAGVDNLDAALLSAANAMPSPASEFDKGMAAGLALAQHIATLATDQRDALLSGLAMATA